MRAFANIEPVESTEKFWRTFFSPAGCFRIVCVTKDFTSEKIKKLMKDYAPENAKYVCEIPNTTVEDVYAGTIEAVCNAKETAIVIDFTNLKEEDFRNDNMSLFQDRLRSIIYRHMHTPIRVIIPEGVYWRVFGHNDLRECWNVIAYVCLKGVKGAFCA